jgi:hypothetical protein
LSSLELKCCKIPLVELRHLPGLKILTLVVHNWGRSWSWEHEWDAESISRTLKHLPQLTKFSAVVNEMVLIAKDAIHLAQENEKLQRLMPELDIRITSSWDHGEEFDGAQYVPNLLNSM